MSEASKLTSTTEKSSISVEYQALKEAVVDHQIFVELSTEGVIEYVNDAFLASFNYSLGEIKGQQYHVLVDKNYANSFEYKSFWKELSSGFSQS